MATNKQSKDATLTGKESAVIADADALVCECNVIHEKTVASVRKGLPRDSDLVESAELFKVLGDPTRLKIVSSLLLEELCVCDVAAVMGMSQPAVSHHLKVLKAARLVKYRRDGKQIYYSLDDEHVTNIFYQGLLHASHK